MIHCPQREGVPSLMVMDRSKEQTLAKFRQKLQDTGCERKITEPFFPWQNANQREIKEFKKGAGRMLLITNMPRSLWEDCLEYEVYVRSHTNARVADYLSKWTDALAQI